jgi:hypothetical protein
LLASLAKFAKQQNGELQQQTGAIIWIPESNNDDAGTPAIVASLVGFGESAKMIPVSRQLSNRAGRWGAI